MKRYLIGSVLGAALLISAQSVSFAADATDGESSAPAESVAPTETAATEAVEKPGKVVFKKSKNPIVAPTPSEAKAADAKSTDATKAAKAKDATKTAEAAEAASEAKAADATAPAAANLTNTSSPDKASSTMDAVSVLYKAPNAAQEVRRVGEAQDNLQLVTYFWDQVFNKHNAAVIDTMVGEDYKQHSPSFKDGKASFKEAITGFLKAEPESTAEIKHVAASDDLVFIHNHIKMNKKDRGQAAVDIFRVKDGKIVEHWDIIQDIPEKAENDNTMF